MSKLSNKDTLLTSRDVFAFIADSEQIFADWVNIYLEVQNYRNRELW